MEAWATQTAVYIYIIEAFELLQRIVYSKANNKPRTPTQWITESIEELLKESDPLQDEDEENNSKSIYTHQMTWKRNMC